MDFLKTFQEALALGLSKEEFIDIWKTESQFKLALQEKSQTSQKVAHDDKQQVKNDKVNHCCDSENLAAYNNVVKSMFSLQREEYKQELYIHFQSLCKQLLEQQEHHWQQMQLKIDKLLEEIRNRLEVLSIHVSNSTDSNAGSIKLHFMQEIELLKQDLEKVIKEHVVNNGSNVVVPYLPKQQESVLNVQDTTTQTEMCDDDDEPVRVDVHSKQNNELHKHFSKLVKLSSHHQKQNILSQATTETKIEDQLDTTELLNKIEIPSKDQQPVSNCTTNTKGELHIDVVMTKEVDKNPTGTSESNMKNWPKINSILETFSTPTVKDKSVMETDCPPIAATGERNYPHLSPTSSVESESHKYWDYPVKIQSPLLSVSDLSLTESDPRFNICVSENIKEFLSPFFYSNGKACKARVRINIELSGALSVHLHVSKGPHDDDFKWPLHISGHGLVFNSGSNCFTPIWQLKSVVCQKPSSKEEVNFKCVVNLQTSRHKYADVTYSTLVLKKYAVNQIMTFKTVLYAM